MAALAFWRDYSALDAAYRAWKADWGAALLARGGGGDDAAAAAAEAYVDLGHSTETAVAGGEALAERLLQLAGEDALAPLADPGEDVIGEEDPAGVRVLVVAAGAGGEEGDAYRSSMVGGCCFCYSAAWGGWRGVRAWEDVMGMIKILQVMWVLVVEAAREGGGRGG